MMTSGHKLSARYVLVRSLGQGGTGEVWLAQDLDRGVLVALKLFAPDLAASSVFLDDLERQVQRVQSLRHPHILEVESLHREGTQAWLVMPYVGNGDLSQMRGRPWSELRRILLPVAEALAHAHAQGVVHRDVKAANVLLGVDGTPRLADFGIALARGERPDDTASRGSPYSASPQQLAGDAATPADDTYAFGVLLYELLSGYPPFYPDIDADKVRSVQPPSVPARFPVPEELVALIDACLAKDPVRRPSMMTVVERLRSLSPNVSTDASIPQLVPPRAPEPPLRAQWQRPTAAVAAPDPARLRSEGFRRGLVVAAFVVLVMAAGIVMFVLPARMAPEVPRATAPVAAPAPALPQAATPEDLARLAQEKQVADDQLAALTPRMTALEEKAVEAWGAGTWAQVRAETATAAQRYAERDYAGAAALYESAANRVAELEQRVAPVLAEALTRGNAALAGGSATEAREAFELALKLSPDNAAATRGLKRSTTLDEVMRLVDAGQNAEREDKFQAAADHYAQALALDADTTRAREGLARMQARLAGNAYAAAMAQGYAALKAKDFAAAKSGFESAAKMRPDAAEVNQALQQVAEEERTVIIAGRQKSASEHEAAERWAQALAEHRAILALDATVASAQQGVARVEPRVRLHDELQLYVTQPERLFNAAVRASARTALQRAQSMESRGPVLEQQVATLSDWLARVEVPVQVALESDNLTQVTIYRVGELGTFTRRALELTPGRYTVVGTRPGYRDVRREILVAPGESPAPVVIRCEDQI